jgi:rod shape-determining protein MreC
VIAKDVSSEFRAVRINRGESSGIRKNMAVITNEGVVGRVLRTTRKTADVMTVLDLLSAVDSIVERSRARGIVEGMTDEVCQLKFVIRTDDIEPGDLLITSGLGGIFPKGIPVGTVSRANRKAYGISQEVEVRPSVDFSRLEEVMIVTQQSTAVNEIEATESLNEPEAAPSAAPETATPKTAPKEEKKPQEKEP